MAELKTFFNRARTVAASLTDRGLATYAASCAFYMFLSLFPMAALAASLLPCMGIPEAALLHLMDGIAPTAVAGLLKGILTNVYENVFPALPISMVVLLFSSAQAFSKLLKGMTAMVDPERRTNYLQQRFRAILLTMALLTALLLSLAVLVFGSRIVLVMGLMYPNLAALLGPVLWLRYLVMAVLLWLMFVFLYRSIPGQQLSFREVRAGAALSAMAWILFSALFSLYAGRLVDLTLYGSMAAMVLTMMWLLYCQYIVLIGAGLCGWKRNNAYWAESLST